MAAHLFPSDGISELVAVLGIDNHLTYLSELTLPTHCEERGVKEWMVLSQIILDLVPGDKKQDTVKTLYNITRYIRIVNIRQKFAGNGSVSIKIPS